MAVVVWHLQSIIKAHFTNERLADPVDEGLWFLSSLRAAAAYLQFHHITLGVLRNRMEEKTKNST